MSKKHISQPWLNFIKQGIKTYEGRLNRGFWSKIKKDDKLILFDRSIEVPVTVVGKETLSKFCFCLP